MSFDVNSSPFDSKFNFNSNEAFIPPSQDESINGNCSINFNWGFCDSQKIYEKLSSLSEHSLFLLFPHIPDWVFFVLRLELSLGTTIAAVIGQAVVDLKLAVKRELVLTHYPCHARGSITRSDDLKANPLPLC